MDSLRKNKNLRKGKKVNGKLSESEKALSDMIQPQVFQVPDVQFQRKLVEDINAIFDKKVSELNENRKNRSLSREEENFLYALQGDSLFGGIVLENLEGNSISEVMKNAKFVDTSKDQGSAYKFSVLELLDSSVQQRIIENSLTTMERAGQLNYLKKSGLVDSEYKLVIEIHYVRSRPYKDSNSTNGLHKDTMGETLFVNLNYLNDKKIAGPEFIVSPLSDEFDQERLRDYVKLPGKFLDDLEKAKKQHTDRDGDGNILIETVDINDEYSVLSFVDEGIHHSTPSLEHRSVTAKQIYEKYVVVNYAEDEYNRTKVVFDSASEEIKKADDELKKADSEFTKRNSSSTFFKVISSPFSKVEENHRNALQVRDNAVKKHETVIEKFTSFTKNRESAIETFLNSSENYLKDKDGWLAILNGQKTKKYNRHDLRKLLPNLPDGEIDQLIDKGGYEMYGRASIPRFRNDPNTGKGQTVNKDIKQKDDHAVTRRRMSMRLTNNDSPPKPVQGEKRAFFRTWVRIVKK